jgi:SAM-dependent methyltransferase
MSDFTLKDLVSYRCLLDQFDIDGCHSDARHRFDALLMMLNQYPQLDFKKSNDRVRQDINQVDQSFAKVSESLQKIKQHFQGLIQDRYEAYLAESYRLFYELENMVPTEQILDRQLSLHKDDREKLVAKLENYSSWMFPGLIIRPGRENFIDKMVANDPLYVADIREELIDQCLDKFNPTYQDIVRRYVFSEKKLSKGIVKALPDHQLGFVFAYNFFNFKPLEITQQYLRELAAKIRPGGRFLLTFNDCDRPHGVALFEEKKYMSFIPGHLLVQSAVEAGFVVDELHQGAGDVCWLELRKHGELATSKGGSVLTKTLARSK